MNERSPTMLALRPWSTQQTTGSVSRLIRRTLLEIGWSDVAGEVRAVMDLLADQDRGIALLAEVDGRLIGAVAAERRTTRPALFIRWLVVDPDFRRQGVASALMNTLEASSGVLRIDGMVDQQDAAAVGFWQSRGWTVLRPCLDRRRQLMGTQPREVAA